MGVDYNGDGETKKPRPGEKQGGDSERVVKGEVSWPSGIEVRKDWGILETF